MTVHHGRLLFGTIILPLGLTIFGCPQPSPIGGGSTGPTAVDDSYSTEKNTALTVSAPGVLNNDTDADSDPLSAEKLTDPVHGTVVVNTNGSFTYTPAADYHGEDSFTYQASDGSASSAAATVTITVNNTGTPPPIPSSFYGQLHFDQTPTLVGQTLSFSVAGIAAPVATAVITRQGETGPLTYLVDVPGDRPETVGVEGGNEGDVVTVSLGGRVLAKGAWHSGVHAQLDVYSHAVTLPVGWNLVSFAILPADDSPEQVLWSLAGKYDIVYGWNAAGQSWRHYAVEPGYGNDLLHLTPAMGLWIHVTAPNAELQVVGALPTSATIPLVSGWNLVGYPSSESRGIPAGAYARVYAYHPQDAADPWKIYDAQAPAYANDLDSLDPGWGYWVRPGTQTAWPPVP